VQIIIIITKLVKYTNLSKLKSDALTVHFLHRIALYVYLMMVMWSFLMSKIERCTDKKLARCNIICLSASYHNAAVL